jgi:predicted transcriptional regulator
MKRNKQIASMPATTTVRIDDRTNTTLDRLARETGLAKKDLIHAAVERLRRERILTSANAGFAALRGDSAAWSEELAERALWDATSPDGFARE